MATRDLDRLAKLVKAHRLELYPSRLAAATAVEISKDTWKRVEEGKEVREGTYAKISKALGWSIDSCDAIATGGQPVFVDNPDSPTPAPTANPEDVKRAVFEAARAKLPNIPIGDIDAFGDEVVEVLRRAGRVLDGSD